MNFGHDEVSKKPAEEILTDICKIDKDSDAGKLILRMTPLLRAERRLKSFSK